MDWVVWIGIVVRLSQSAMFCGLNLGMLGSSRLRLQVAASGGNKGARRTWIIIIDEDGLPRLVLNASVFLRAVLMNVGSVDPHDFCHEPVVIADPACKLESVSGEIRLRARQPGGDRMYFGPVVLWTPEDKRILTGAHLLKNLLRGIAEP